LESYQNQQSQHQKAEGSHICITLLINENFSIINKDKDGRIVQHMAKILTVYNLSGFINTKQKNKFWIRQQAKSASLCHGWSHTSMGFASMCISF